MNDSYEWELRFFSINDGASFSDDDLIVVYTVNLTCRFRVVQNMALMNFFNFTLMGPCILFSICIRIGYNRPTLCTDYYSFIYYSGSYMFRHLCAIFRGRPLSLCVTWKSEMVVSSGCAPCTVNVGGLCAPDVVVSCVTVSSWALTHIYLCI
jgi:hypothetical protein